jgi:hypothetical protein
MMSEMAIFRQLTILRDTGDTIYSPEYHLCPILTSFFWGMVALWDREDRRRIGTLGSLPSLLRETRGKM